MSEDEILLNYYRKQVQIMRAKFPDYKDEKYYGSSFHGQYPFYSQDFINDVKTWLKDYDRVFRVVTKVRGDEK